MYVPWEDEWRTFRRFDLQNFLSRHLRFLFGNIFQLDDDFELSDRFLTSRIKTNSDESIYLGNPMQMVRPGIFWSISCRFQTCLKIMVSFCFYFRVHYWTPVRSRFGILRDQKLRPLDCTQLWWPVAPEILACVAWYCAQSILLAIVLRSRSCGSLANYYFRKSYDPMNIVGSGISQNQKYHDISRSVLKSLFFIWK